MWLACVNLQPASARHISSRLAFDLEAWHCEGLCWVGPQTWLSPCQCPPGCSCCMHHLLCIVLYFWLPKSFSKLISLICLFSVAWAATRSANHLSLQPWLCFSLVYFLYPVQPCAETWSSERVKFIGMWLMPPFLSRDFAPMQPPQILFCTPFHYKIQATTWVSWGHHGTFPTISFLHRLSAVSLAFVVSSLIASSCHCCACVSLLPAMVFSKSCSWLGRLLEQSTFSNSWL